MVFALRLFNWFYSSFT